MTPASKPLARHRLDSRDQPRRSGEDGSVRRDVPAISDGEALLRVDRVGVTANNVTYALMGVAMHYWDFFPTKAGWGLVPLWGFGEVMASPSTV